MVDLWLAAEEAMAVIPKLPGLYDEPFADSSQIPTFLVSQLARRHVTVALSGDAGDELVCGYNRYVLAARLWQKISRIPQPLRRNVARLITAFPARQWDRLGATARALGAGNRFKHFGD